MTLAELTRMHPVTVCPKCGRIGFDLGAVYCHGEDGCGAVLGETLMTGAELIQAGKF